MGQEALKLPTESETYYFSPDKVIKRTEDIDQGDADKFKAISSIVDPDERKEAFLKYRKILVERGTEKVRQPDKRDLQGLLATVSSAELSRSGIMKISSPEKT